MIIRAHGHTHSRFLILTLSRQAAKMFLSANLITIGEFNESNEGIRAQQNADAPKL